MGISDGLTNKNFIGTYLTENDSTAVVLTRAAMVVDGKKQTIWGGFIVSKSIPAPQFSVWDKEGKSFYGKDWNLKEAVRERAY